MARLLVLTNLVGTVPIPALQLLNHDISCQPLDISSALKHPGAELLILDATENLVIANQICTRLAMAQDDRPVLVVVNEGGIAAISAAWGAKDFILGSAGPGEIDARVRLALESRSSTRLPASERIHAAELVIDEVSYSAKLAGRTLDLTFKEFELLKYLASHPSRVFTREQLLSDVWGYDYFGGTRTVDVHVRRLRSKLGEHEHLIGTVRNVGYQFTVSEEHEHALQPHE